MYHEIKLSILSVCKRHFKTLLFADTINVFTCTYTNNHIFKGNAHEKTGICKQF